MTGAAPSRAIGGPTRRGPNRVIASGVVPPALPVLVPARPLPLPLTVLGIDPGPTSCGWALLHVPRRGRATYGAHGELSPADLVASLAGWVSIHTASGGTLAVACEEPTGAHGGLRGKRAGSVSRQLAKTSSEAISAICYEAGGLHVPLVRLAAGAVRRALGRGVRTDADVGRVIRLMVDGWPGGRASNEHTRDAAAVAFVAAQRLTSGIPPRQP